MQKPLCQTLSNALDKSKKKKNKNKKIPLTSNDRFASCLVMSGVTEMN